ncbi:hypothetical protein JZ751_000107 [Albula glossodonta]|uniref:Peptidase C80 domain-containing protein n=2 Tax=Albula glossodonta TaxID=121402 RepID=A0A8T2PV76_9TELE|nr:hypothetical protein JZ751_000107 [Albula glossodonta]
MLEQWPVRPKLDVLCGDQKISLPSASRTKTAVTLNENFSQLSCLFPRCNCEADFLSSILLTLSNETSMESGFKEQYGLAPAAISAGKLGALSSEILRPDQRVHDDASQVLVCNDTKYRDVEPSAVFASNSLKPHVIESSFTGPDKSARINSMRVNQPVPPREASTPQHIPVGAKTDSQDVGVASNHLTSYDHQNIVVLEDDPVVMESASFLYEKHPSVSTLLRYQKEALHVIRGSRMHLTRNSRVVLVGHGSRGGDGAAILGGYQAEEIAGVVGAMETEDGYVRTVSVVGCELGRDLSFATRLLRALRSLHVETKLHLRLSALSITRSGEKVTREEGNGLPTWRHKDGRNKIIAWLDGAENLLTRVEESQRGRTPSIMPKKHKIPPSTEEPKLKKTRADENQTPEWPAEAERFKKKTLNCAKLSHYFMAAVFAESVRNFRNFSLFLMWFANLPMERRITAEDRLTASHSPYSQDEDPLSYSPLPLLFLFAAHNCYRAHCRSEPSHLLDDSRTLSDENRYEYPETQYCPVQEATVAPNDRIPAYLPSVVDITHNSSVPWTYESGSFSQVEWAVASKHSTSYDHQNIVVLENDPVVMESASFLYEKHPSVSTLLSYQKGALHVIRGSRMHLTRNSRVVLVGHGSRGGDGAAILGGYQAEEIAGVVGAMETEDGRVRTVSVVGCELGRDLLFATRLLRALRSLHVETKLHLRRSALSITPSGEKVTREEGNGPPTWRHKDGRNKIIAWLDGTGNLLTREEERQRGRVVPHYQGQALHIEPLDWPTHPQMFVPAELRAKYTSIDCLEGLTWSLFFEANEKSRAPDYALEDSRANHTIVWLNGQEPSSDISIKHIVTILDLVREIRYVAKENVNADLYYALNDIVYKVEKRTLYVSIAGKTMDPQDQDEILRFTGAFKAKREHLTLRDLRQGLKASEFNDFCRQTFQFRQCEGSSNCERWGHYFMAAVFSESVRNFRTFSLFLMSVIACEVSRFQGPDDQICTAFVGEDHPMVGAGTWLERDKRGFYGCSLSTADEWTKRDKLVWLEEVLRKENALFSRTKAKMVSVYGQQEDAELDIFGKVKVINQYAFSSFIEYFRGTNEGRKLSRGCMSHQ